MRYVCRVGELNQAERESIHSLAVEDHRHTPTPPVPRDGVRLPGGCWALPEPIPIANHSRGQLLAPPGCALDFTMLTEHSEKPTTFHEWPFR